MRPLRIGVNALYLKPGAVGGTEIYLRNLLQALAGMDGENEYFVFTNRETGRVLVPCRPNFHCVPQPVPGRIRPLRIVWEQTGLPIAASQKRLDVLFNPGFTAPILCRCPMVTVFHDLQHKRHPEHFRWFDLPFWRALLYASACRSTSLMAVSESTRDDLLRYYRLPASSVGVVPHGVSDRFFEIGKCRRDSETQPYFLCVSTLHPHKNLSRLVRVFAEFRRTRPEFSLVLAGVRGFHAGAVETLIRRLKLEEWVRVTGWVSDEELLELYRFARAFVYPSTFEGFGMPVLEALAAGIPTACSSIDPLTALAGGLAPQFAPDDEVAMLRHMIQLVSDRHLRDRFKAEGPARAAEYTWSRTAGQTLEILNRAARGAG